MRRLLLALAVFVVAAELSLQLLGLFQPLLLSRAGRVEPGDDARRILCVGDSHTYGAPLPADESYPAQLQRRLDARGADTYRVFNRGVPGINSRMVANRLEGWLEQYRPDLVILWIGANNVWNDTETSLAEGWLGAGRRALFRLKLVRLLTRLRHDAGHADTARPERIEWRPRESEATWRIDGELLEIDPSAERPARSAAAEDLSEDLGSMIETVRAHGAAIVLVTYPYQPGPYWLANQGMRAASEEYGVEILETGLDMARAKRDGLTGDELVVNAAGPHPRAPLYGYIVDSLLPIVDDHLAESAAAPGT